MPLIDLKCSCGTVTEHLISFSEGDREFECSGVDCKEKLTRSKHRHYSSEGAPVVRGETTVGKKW